MIARLRTWWDRRSPWRVASRAQGRAEAAAVQLLEVEAEFTGYITWATERLEDLKHAAIATMIEVQEAEDANGILHDDNDTLRTLTATFHAQRDSARQVAVHLEQENAHLLAVVRSANVELCKAVMWAPAQRMPELAAVLDDVDAALAGVHG